MAPRVLIVEDNDQFATVVEHLLRRRGLTTERARNGLEALERIATAAPAALLLDLRLPGMSGIDLLRRLRQEPGTRDLPTIIMTGVFRGEQYTRAAQALGVRHYLEKPFRAEELLNALRQVLKPPAPAAQRFDSHLQRALANRFSGRYRLRHGDSERSLLLADGLPVFLDPGFLHRDFGDYLFRRGVISAEEYGYYRHAQNGRPEALIQMGCLEYGHLLQERFDYLNLELIGAFGQPPMTVVEEPFALPPELHPITVNLPDIFYQGGHRHPDPEADRQLLAECGGRYVAPSAGYFHRINFLTLRSDERSLLGRLDGTRTLSECLAGEMSLLGLIRTLSRLEMLRFADTPLAVPATPDFPLRTLFNSSVDETVPAGVEEETTAAEALESFADLVEEAAKAAEAPSAAAAPQPAAAAPTGTSPGVCLGQKVKQTLATLEGKNYYQVFGLDPGRFSFQLLKERYFQITREYGPDVLMQLSGIEATMVEELLATVTAAYNTLSDVVKKERYDELLGSERIGLGQKGDDRFQSQVQFQSAKVFLEMEEWDSAEKALQDACNIEPENGVYLAHLAWALYRNPVHASSRAMLDKARQTLNRALTMERSADGYAFKGRMLLDASQDGLAEVEFGKALKLDARQLLARAGLRQIQERREQEKRGLLRRLFR